VLQENHVKREPRESNGRRKREEGGTWELKEGILGLHPGLGMSRG
jgi:hypothetical protein